MTTALECITGAAKLIGVVFKSESLSADEAADGLNALNDMLNSWSNDDLITFSRVREYFTLQGGKAAYTIGSGGDFNTTRPVNICAGFVRVGTVDYPLEIVSNVSYETEITIKSIPSPIPRFLNYSNEYPLATITLYPVPSAANQIWLLSNKPLGTYTALTDTVSLPVGFIKAIKYNLAIMLAPEYGVEPSAIVYQEAKKSLGSLKATTAANNPLPLLGQIGREWNYLGGWL